MFETKRDGGIDNMKIVCLIRHEPALIYFANRIHERHRIDLAVVESPVVNESMAAKIASRGLTGTIHSVARRLSRGKTAQRLEADFNEFFGEKWRALDPGIPVLRTENINSQAVQERLESEKPDLILDHGTSLVKDHILKTAGLALNLHWGLSPYYRGTFCTEWALINWDPYNIGVTIHKLTKIIDGGSILAQKRATVRPTDTAHTIDMQLTALGTELVITAIDKMKRGEELCYHPQDVTIGYLTRNSQWSEHAQMQVEYIEKRGLVAAMMQKPSRKQKLPIIEFE
jgi:folate-dependent phosphoribosylglycinamide formyltransferase PurN